LEGLGIEKVVIFFDLLEYFTAIGYNLQPFGIVCGNLVYFSPFWYVWTKKNLEALLVAQIMVMVSIPDPRA
jgi:ABC-type spermidine/putrescine transport system permease subunit II